MPRISKIVQFELENEVLSLASQGMSSREISKEIKKKENKNISYVAINKFLQETREERAESSKRTIQEHIQKSIPDDLQNLDDMNNKLLEWFNDENLKKSRRLQVYNSLLKGIELKLKHSGAEENTVDDVLDKIRSKWGLDK
ncbi:hypothetical protein [Geotoga petraea]|jgi:CRISPR/Cas system CSM-associated protein Csm4 (group 5 of RAMP superfamily)|uniref:Uncharacterized protein n=1 Tax=Geotoga petraea TaxID=28234 RepID=A0A1G6LSN2_9BACT|nr:hypothetical protein [Geotoga petraea]SDC46114.1 hypothetical protein SAMN04488588_1129 [Geotoga petraea]